LEILIIVLFCVFLPFSVLIKPIKKAIQEKKNIKEFIIEYKEELIIVFVLIIGSLVRLVAIGKIPNALNVDEASSGYDGYSLMKNGIDRGGNSYPVYLYAWGSGQSVLYSYLMIPILAITGLTEYGIRLPMALVGIISLYVFYYLLKQVFENKKIALVGTFFFAICPWHIMKSRWGM
jgi:4-amino-4-deoxy-L-arabinose transferase-like glycosyltransferase